jgi:hypothetical protein
MNKVFVTQKVWNPDFIPDLLRLMNIAMSESELASVLKFIEKQTPTTYEKLQTLIDRIEFIGHLSVVGAEAKRQGYSFEGSEVRGIGWDITALRIYLSLTCIDILSTNFEPFDKWIVKNCSDFNSNDDIHDYLQRKAGDYRDLFQLSTNFIKAFTNASDDIKNEVCHGLTVKLGGKEFSEIGKIASYLYRVRNKYTHEGRRFFVDPQQLDRHQTIGRRDEDFLQLRAGFDLVGVILKVAKEQAIRILEKFHKELKDHG